MFEQRLLEARKKKGLTQKQLSDAAGIHPASYSAYETNKKVPPVDILLRITDVLGVSVDWLCGRDQKKNKMSTYGDIARALLKIRQTLHKQSSIPCHIEVKIGEGYMDFQEYIPPSEFMEITISDSELCKFFKKVEAFDTLLKDTPDAHEYYNGWLESALNALDKKVLQNYFEEDNDEDLPF